MKQEIGIRELKAQASSIVRQVREGATEYIHHTLSQSSGLKEQI